jgi:hypothetical protein
VKNYKMDLYMECCISKKWAILACIKYLWCGLHANLFNGCFLYCTWWAELHKLSFSAGVSRLHMMDLHAQLFNGCCLWIAYSWWTFMLTSSMGVSGSFSLWDFVKFMSYSGNCHSSIVWGCASLMRHFRIVIPLATLIIKISLNVKCA